MPLYLKNLNWPIRGSHYRDFEEFCDRNHTSISNQILKDVKDITVEHLLNPTGFLNILLDVNMGAIHEKLFTEFWNMVSEKTNINLFTYRSYYISNNATPDLPDLKLIYTEWKKKMISKLLSSEQKAILKTKFSSCKNEAYNDILAAESLRSGCSKDMIHYYFDKSAVGYDMEKFAFLKLPEDIIMKTLTKCTILDIINVRRAFEPELHPLINEMSKSVMTLEYPLTIHLLSNNYWRKPSGDLDKHKAYNSWGIQGDILIKGWKHLNCISIVKLVLDWPVSYDSALDIIQACPNLKHMDLNIINFKYQTKNKFIYVENKLSTLTLASSDASGRRASHCPLIFNSEKLRCLSLFSITFEDGLFKKIFTSQFLPTLTNIYFPYLTALEIRRCNINAWSLADLKLNLTYFCLECNRFSGRALIQIIRNSPNLKVLCYYIDNFYQRVEFEHLIFTIMDHCCEFSSCCLQNMNSDYQDSRPILREFQQHILKKRCIKYLKNLDEIMRSDEMYIMNGCDIMTSNHQDFAMYTFISYDEVKEIPAIFSIDSPKMRKYFTLE